MKIYLGINLEIKNNIIKFNKDGYTSKRPN